MLPFDPKEQFEQLKSRIIQRATEMLSVEDKNHKVVVNDIWVDDNQDIQDIKSQKEAKDYNRTWSVPVYASISIKDPNNVTVVTTRKMKIFDLPKMTPRQSFIVDGSEYQISNQFRLKPGVYTRELRTGELASQVNLAKGMNFKVTLDPEKGVYKAQFGGQGGSTVGLYSLMKLLSAPEQEIRGALGEDVYKANINADISNDIKKIYRALFYAEPKDEDEASTKLREYFGKTELDEETTETTLGRAHKSVTGGMLIDTAKKLLAVNKGTAEPDNRESLQFKKLMTLEDLVDDRLRVQTSAIQRTIKRRLQTSKEISDVRDIVQPEKINRTLVSLFNTSDLSMNPEQINPAHMINAANKTTIMGEGGIGSRHAIVLEQRDIEPTHLGYLDPVHTPETEAGITLHLTTGADKKDGKIVTQLYNIRTNRSEKIEPSKAFNKVVAFPEQYTDEWKPKARLIDVMIRGKMTKVKPEDVDYVVPSAAHMFSFSTNLVPFVNSNQGARAEMGAKQIEQAISLVEREVPGVQVATDKGKRTSFEALLGRTSSVTSPVSGAVVKVGEGLITIKDRSGKDHKVQLYNNFALNSNTYLHNTATVQAGDDVKEGQVIADSNFTKDGHLSLGKNLLVGYLPYKGYSFEDGIVISEGAARKTTSQHLEKYEEQITDSAELNLKKFLTFFPQMFTTEQLKGLDEEGVIKAGSKVRKGDLIYVFLKDRELTEEDELLGKISNKLKRPYKSVVVEYDKEDEGEVVDVIKSGKHISVRVRVNKVTKIGDKFAGRHGNKGVVTKIVPDNEMPRTEDGKIIDMLLNPSGVPSRINAGQLLETAAGKLAEKSGKPYLVYNFEEDDQLKKVQGELVKAGLKETENVIDPISGKSLGEVTVGRQYILKLNHPTEKKFAARSTGTYTSDMTPGHGSGEGGQSVDPLTTFALLAHGAKHNLREMSTIKAERNDEYWRALQLKEPLPAPRPTFAFQKQMDFMKQLGVNVEKRGSKLQLVPITDSEVRTMSKGPITSGTLFLAKNLKPEQDGLFDPLKTGGLRGDKWSHIDLAELMPHPMFEDAIRSLGNLTGDQFDKFISGDLWVDTSGQINPDGKGLTGGEGLRRLLSKVDLKKAYDDTVEQAKTAKADKLNSLNHKARFIKNLIDNKLDTSIYFTKLVPILPPKYRPIYPREDGSLMTSQINYLYKDTIDVNEQLKSLKDLPESEKKDLRKDLYQAVSAVIGVGDPLTNPEYSGVIDLIKGKNQPKEGFFQSRLISRRQDYSGRSTITGEPNMYIDEAGIPEDMLYKIFEPFIIQELKNFGVAPLEAKDLITKRDNRASQALDKVLQSRTVLLNRAPSLHKHSVMAFKPVRVTGKSIKMHPLVLKGFNADFDGDSCNSFVYLYLQQSNNLTEIIDKVISIPYTSLDGNNPDQTGEERMRYNGNVFFEQKGIHRIHISEMPHLPETKHITEKGTEEYDVPDGVFMFAHDNETGKIQLRKVTKWSVHPDLFAVEVETRKNRKVEVSVDHSLYCIDTKTLECVRVAPMGAEGMKSPCPAFVELPVTEQLTEIDTSAYTKENVYKVNTPLARAMRATTPLSKNFGYLLGTHIGDGFVGVSHGEVLSIVNLANIDDELAAEWVKCAAEILDGPELVVTHLDSPHEFQGHSCKSEKYAIRAKGLAEFLHNACGHRAGNKKLPPFFLAGPEDFRWGMLSGLLATDGQVSITHTKAKAKPTFIVRYDSKSERLADDVRLLCTSLRIRTSKSKYKNGLTGEEYFMVLLSSLDVQTYATNLNLHHEDKQNNLRALRAHAFDNAAVNERHDIVPVPLELIRALRKLVGAPRTATLEQKCLYQQLSKEDDHITRACAFKCVDWLGEQAIKDAHPLGAKWLKIIADQDTHWDVIEKVTPLEGKHTMWDVTIPDAWTFMTADQVVIYDTMSVHVPISSESLTESMGMLPSKNLFNASGVLMSAPDQEAQVGLYMLTREDKITNLKFPNIQGAMGAYDAKKIDHNDVIFVAGERTTLGRLLVNNLLPIAARNNDLVMDKKTSKILLTDIAKNNPMIAADIINKLKDIGNQSAYEKGFTVGLKDLEIDRKPIDAAYKKIDPEVEEIMLGKATPAEKEQRLLTLFGNADREVEASLRSQFMGKRNSFADMVVSGAKGSWGQVKQLAAAPGLISRVTGGTIPYGIRTAYSQGLTPAEYWVATYGARKGQIERSKQTAEPGEMNKSLIHSSLDMRISVDDCGTHRGIRMKVSDPESEDRFLAENTADLKRNDLLTGSARQKLQRARIVDVLVRSPLTCEAPHGICAKCFGLNEYGKPTVKGTNIGVISAQSITEPATQMSMSSFHTGGLAGAPQVDSFTKVRQLLEFPKEFKHSAVLAKVSGIVNSIKEGPAGGFYVTVGTTEHFIPPRMNVMFKKGNKVERGDQLSDGIKNPHEVLELQGLPQARNYIANELYQTYKDLGKDIRKKHFEVVARSVTNTTQVLDNKENEDFVPGDLASYDFIVAQNRKSSKMVSVDKAKGKFPIEPVAGIGVPFNALSEEDIAELKQMGITELEVSDSPMIHKPVLKGIEVIPQKRRDWLSGLAYRNLKDILKKGVQEGWKSDLAGQSPIPGFVAGVDMTTAGEGKSK